MVDSSGGASMTLLYSDMSESGRVRKTREEMRIQQDTSRVHAPADELTTHHPPRPKAKVRATHRSRCQGLVSDESGGGGASLT